MQIAVLSWECLLHVGLLVTLTLSLFFARPADPSLVFGGMLRFDWFGFLFKMFFVFAAAVTALFFMDTDSLNQRAEAYLLLLAATIGMCLMASSADLVMLYLAIETTSIPLYILAGFLTGDEKSSRVGFQISAFRCVDFCSTAVRFQPDLWLCRYDQRL